MNAVAVTARRRQCFLLETIYLITCSVLFMLDSAVEAGDLILCDFFKYY